MLYTLKTTFLRLFAFLVFLPCLGLAQPSRALHLAEAVNLARFHSSQLRADSIGFQIIGTQVSQARNNLFPQISLNSNFQRLSNNVKPFIISFPQGAINISPQILNQSFNNVQLRELLFGGGRVRSSIKALQKEEAAGKQDFRRSQLNLEQQVTELWFNLYNAQVSARIIKTNIEALNQRRGELDQFRVQGLVLANDVLKIELNETELRSNLADINSATDALNYNLCILTGIDPATRIDIPEEFIPSVPTDIKSRQEYLNSAEQIRPEMQAFQLRSQAAGYRIKAAKADYYPSLSLVGSYDYDRPNQRIVPNVDAFNYSALAGLTLTWNISSFYTNRSHVRENRLAAEQLNNQFQSTRENIQKEVNSAYINYSKALDKLSLTKTELVQATENYRVEKNKLNTQTTTPTDFLVANASLLQAQLNLATANANAELAYRKLVSSTGENIN